MLEGVFRREGGRIIGALAARYRDLDAAEEAFAEACARAAAVWPQGVCREIPLRGCIEPRRAVCWMRCGGEMCGGGWCRIHLRPRARRRIL
jgi:hypothetical protein